MKKIKYIFVIVVFMMILSGCTVTENINVSSSGKVKESSKIVRKSSEISSDINNYLDSIINKYSKAFNAKKYSYNKIVDENDVSGLEVYKDYDNICEFVEDTGFSQYLYKKITCIENDYYYEIKSEGQNIFYCPGCSDWPLLEKISLNINLPVKAEEDNADNVSNNTYTWFFDENTSSDKSVYLKINKESLKKEEIKEKNEEKKKEKKKKVVSSVSKIGFVIVFLVIVIFVLYNLYKKYKNNKLEY